MVHLKKNRLFNLVLLLAGVLFAQDSTPATGAGTGAFAFIGADRPDELIGTWESVISDNEADTTKVLELYADGRFVYSEKTTTNESIKQNLIRELGTDAGRIQFVADSLAIQNPRFHDALVADKRVDVIELTGTWGVTGNAIQTVVDSFSLSFNGLEGNDIFYFYEIIISLVVPAEYAELVGFFMLGITLLQEGLDALVEAREIYEFGRYSFENDTLVVVQDESTVRYTRISEEIPSDFDGDGTVGFPDFLLFVAQFGSSHGTAGYDARFDLDGDDSIGFSDFLIFVGVFGTTSETTSLPPPPPPPPPTSNVDIPDANLRAVIEDSLGKASGAPITRAEMATLTHLTAQSKNIQDLTGLEFATNLTTLRLLFNRISDVSPLSNLTNLTELLLWDNRISDVAPLSNLTNLTRLGLNGNSISDVAPLSNLTNLTTLELPYNRISDVAPLSNLTNLTTLELGENSISDVAPLSNLTNLTWLNLYNNSISDLAPLVANTGLGSGDYVAVYNNPLSNTSINTHIPALQARGVRVRVVF